MTNTTHNLVLKFRHHGYGNQMGTLRVYTDDAAASNHASATLVATLTGESHSGIDDN